MKSYEVPKDIISKIEASLSKNNKFISSNFKKLLTSEDLTYFEHLYADLKSEFSFTINEPYPRSLDRG